jgi:Zn-finger nucleic acid-binding protein
MKCPVCKVHLIVVERHKIELDYCISCKGFWFDAGELKLLSETLNLNLLNEIKQTIIDDSTEHKRICPLCDKTMNIIRIGENSNVLLDKCPDGQGIWLDGGELSKITNQNKELSKLGSKEIVNFLGEFLIPD